MPNQHPLTAGLLWLWYAFFQTLSQLLALLLFRIRVFGRGNVPDRGGTLLISNHQSFLDPVLVGLSLSRHLRYLARDSLFKLAPAGWFIGSLGAIPIHREGTGLTGLKATLRLLRAGDAVLIFPEGTRSRDGRIGRLRPGVNLLVQRAGAAIVPVAVAGAFEAWPRGRRLFRPRPICVQFGPPIDVRALAALEPDAVTEVLRREIAKCFEQARRGCERSASGRCRPGARGPAPCGGAPG